MVVLDSIFQLCRKLLFVNWKIAFIAIAVKNQNSVCKRIGIIQVLSFILLEGALNTDLIFRSFFLSRPDEGLFP